GRQAKATDFRGCRRRLAALPESPEKYRIHRGCRPAAQYLFRDECDIEVLHRADSWISFQSRKFRETPSSLSSSFAHFVTFTRWLRGVLWFRGRRSYLRAGGTSQCPGPP